MYIKSFAMVDYKDATINGNPIMIMSNGKGDLNFHKIVKTLLSISKDSGESEFRVDLSDIVKKYKIKKLDEMLNDMASSYMLLIGKNCGLKAIFEKFGVYEDSEIIKLKINKEILDSLD